MLKVNGTEIKNVKFNGVDLDKVIVNGVIVFEKVQFNNTVTMRTLQDSITITVQTKDLSPCEVWNAGNKIGMLNHDQSTSIPIPNKNEVVIIKGKDITSLYCNRNYLTSLDVHGLNSLQSLVCLNNQLTSLDVNGLNSLQYLFCYRNQLTGQNFKNIFNNLLQTENGIAIVYSETNDNNYKDFTRPPDLVEAFNGAKARGWKFYKNSVGYHNLI